MEKSELFETVDPVVAALANVFGVGGSSLMNALFGLDGLIWAQVVADVIHAVIALLVFRKVKTSITGA